MTVAELIKELKQYPKNAEVYLVKDWDEQDEDGHWLDLHRLEYTVDQTIYIETGMDFLEEHQIILDFETTKAKTKINRSYD